MKNAAATYRFGSFTLQTRDRRLSSDGHEIYLRPRTYETLLYLLERHGHLVTKDELLDTVWAGVTVTENALTRCIKEARSALGDEVQQPAFLRTIPRLGYEFIADVEASEALAEEEVVEEEFRAMRLVTTEEDNDDRAKEPLQAERSAAVSRPQSLLPQKATIKTRVMVGLGVMFSLALLAAAIDVFLHTRQRPTLTEQGAVVLGDFANTTGEPVFDDTLKQALTIALRESPFLNVFPDSRVAATLKLMTRPVGTKLTPDVAQELCQRAGSKAYIAGSIASLGNEYVLGLKAVNCQSGDTLAEEQITAASKEKVLNALGEAAVKLRSELGESLATVQKFDVPLEQATTSSLEALQAYSLGTKIAREKGVEAALPFQNRAIHLDPNFAMAYHALGSDYFTQAELARASEYYTRAFELREHASEREKLLIRASYYQRVSGELDKATQTYQEMVDNYPRDYVGYFSLAVLYATQGRYERAMESAIHAQQLARDDVGPCEAVVLYNLALQHFDQARQTIQEAQSRTLDGMIFHNALYALAFLAGDAGSISQQQQWFADRADVEHFGLSLESDTEADAGHLVRARELSKRASDSAMRADSKEDAAIWLENAALRDAAFGNLAEARQAAAAGVKLSPVSLGVEVLAALTYAMIGDTVRAESLARDLSKRYPLDTQMQSLWLPAIEGQLALNRKSAAEAANYLGTTWPPIEYGAIAFFNQTSCLYPTYIRGQAYLAAGQGTAAAAEFQKILDHSGIVWNCWTGALARLGVARANALQAKNSQSADADLARTRSLAAYKDFLALWKDADPDIPIFKAAKAEYAKLQ